ncbi:hypothetical protein JL475_32210 [Streptomyces sp. M2CJ-2]|uniref:hypothetical protein n=1 Tax=Streptomyces sp. M2CJ-2 TaxID=2803948 RepID=UPI00192737B2|nr:hypothetical protein [Streptomyces sp. M2CJ-2]MBL3670558.1 hypothetical protein [Streptomyces sp. M2CJ-2]
MSLTDAGACLGMPPSWTGVWGRFRPLEERLHGHRADLPALFQHLTDYVARQSPTDYYDRRQRYTNRILPALDMQEIIESYAGRTTHRRRLAEGRTSPHLLLRHDPVPSHRQRVAAGPGMEPPTGPADEPAATCASVVFVLEHEHPDHPFSVHLHTLLSVHVSKVIARAGG